MRPRGSPCLLLSAACTHGEVLRQQIAGRSTHSKRGLALLVCLGPPWQVHLHEPPSPFTIPLVPHALTSFPASMASWVMSTDLGAWFPVMTTCSRLEQVQVRQGNHGRLNDLSCVPPGTWSSPAGCRTPRHQHSL